MNELDTKIYLRALLKINLPIFAKRMLKIRDVTGKVVPFSFNPEQLYAYSVLRLLRQRPYATLLRIFKARKRGMSSMFTGDMLHQFQYNPGNIQEGYIYGHKASSSKTLFDILKRFYEFMPDSEKWEIEQDTQKVLKYINGSLIEVKTVGAVGDEGRSKTPNYLLMTEISRYGNDAGDVVSGIMSGVETLNNPGLTVVQESTSAGFDTYWQPNHERFVEMVNFYSKKYGIRATRAEEISGETTALKLLKAGVWPDDFFHVFIPWFWSPLNKVPLTEEQKEELRSTLTDYESQIMEEFSLTEEQIAYRRHQKEVHCNNDENMTKQEFPCTADESFIASGAPVFDVVKIESERLNVIRLPEIKESADIQLVNSGRLATDGKLVSYTLKYSNPPIEVRPGLYKNQFKAEVEAVALPDMLGEWIEFSPPQKDWKNRYVIGADCALGKENSDDDAAVVIDRVERRAVAKLSGKFGIDFFPEQLAMMATRYHYAQVLVENNNNGEGIILRLNQLYPFVMVPTRTRKGIDEILPTTHYGIRTLGGTKALVIGNLKNYLNEFPSNPTLPRIPFEEILLQMRSFVFKGSSGEMGAEGSKKDDLVMAMAIALEAARIMDISGLMPKPVVESKTLYKFGGIVYSPDSGPPSPRCY